MSSESETMRWMGAETFWPHHDSCAHGERPTQAAEAVNGALMEAAKPLKRPVEAAYPLQRPVEAAYPLQRPVEAA